MVLTNDTVLVLSVSPARTARVDVSVVWIMNYVVTPATDETRAKDTTHTHTRTHTHTHTHAHTHTQARTHTQTVVVVFPFCCRHCFPGHCTIKGDFNFSGELRYKYWFFTLHHESCTTFLWLTCTSSIKNPQKVIQMPKDEPVIYLYEFILKSKENSADVSSERCSKWVGGGLMIQCVLISSLQFYIFWVTR